MSAEATTPSCQATQTFHHHCGHIITTFTHHSDLCVRNQNNRPATASSTISDASLRLHSSASSALKDMGQSLGKLARRLTIRSSQPKKAQTTTHEFTFTARVPCPQVLFQPLYLSRPCSPCAKALGMGPNDVDKNLAGADEDRWHREKESLDAQMIAWVAKIGEWDRGVRIPRKG
ncbi:hypothetical protein EAE96_002125 [Botrytis aclada]|nr:hypothetical protein EAE96_002125 [Botrytis aclada]